MKTINLILKKQWFEMIISGIKKEEYRDDSRYWNSRFFNSSDCSWKDFDTVMFHEGYHKNRRKMLVEIKDIGFGTGRPDWGAIEAKRCFIISLGKILKTYNVFPEPETEPELDSGQVDSKKPAAAPAAGNNLIANSRQPLPMNAGTGRNNDSKNEN